MLKKRIKDNRFYFVSERSKVEDIKWIILSFIANIYSRILLVICNRNKKLTHQKKHKVAICAIFKNEDSILLEWLSYHLAIGVDHFYMYNNFSCDNYIKTLTPFINDNIVTLVDWPIDNGQIPAYKHCWQSFKKDSDWIGFIDLDEFIVPIKSNDIKSFLSNFQNYPSLMIHWKMFGSSGLINHNENLLHIEQYFMSWDILYEYGKTFYNTLYEIKDLDSKVLQHYGISYTKFANIKLPFLPVNDSKVFLLPFYLKFGKRTQDDIIINHYWSKSFESYSDKIKKGRADETNNFINYELFFKCELMNKKTDYSISRFVVQTKLNMEKYKTK